MKRTAETHVTVAAIAVLALTASLVAALAVSRHHISTSLASASGAPAAPPTSTPTSGGEPSNVQLSAPSTNVVWALVDYSHLYQSTDQGTTWVQRSIPTQLGVRPSISFVDDHEGWLLAPGSPTTQCQEASAGVWHTSDAGKTWAELPARGLGIAQCKDLVWFADANDGFVSAHDPNHRPTIYRTSDGGSIWSPSALPDPPDFKTAEGGFTLQVRWLKRFGLTLYVLAYGRQGAGSPYPDVPDRQYIFVSTDGGATWQWREKTVSPSLVMVTETRWLDLSAPGRTTETLDGGHSYGPYASDFNSDASDAPQVTFAAATVGYATVRGSIQRTLDGGAHWTYVKTPASHSLA